jgi:superfamily II DNA/RNA helicase
VIHWEVPKDNDIFVHRSGRAGRAGTTGTNVVLADDYREEMSRLRDIVNAVGIGHKAR